MRSMSHFITRQEAIDQRLQRYFTGEPCKHGHVSERRTVNGTCLECETDSRRRLAKLLAQGGAEAAKEPEEGGAR